MQNFIVAIIVGLAALHVGRTFYRSLKKGNGCGCGCSGCGQQDGCDIAASPDPNRPD
jgi:hypothetical protein